jgi:hypothetical protein
MGDPMANPILDPKVVSVFYMARGGPRSFTQLSKQAPTHDELTALHRKFSQRRTKPTVSSLF